MNPRARDASLGDSNRSSGDQDMTLQSLSHVEKMWKISELNHRNKQHPDDFPKLPEIPAGRYSSEDFFRLEQEHVWKRTWLVAGIAGALPRSEERSGGKGCVSTGEYRWWASH